MTVLQELVHSALDNALANGYDDLVLRAKPEEVAGDLVAYDDDVAQAVAGKTADLIPLIEKWREQHPLPCPVCGRVEPHITPTHDWNVDR